MAANTETRRKRIGRQSEPGPSGNSLPQNECPDGSDVRNDEFKAANMAADLSGYFVLEFYRDPLIPVPTILVSSALGTPHVTGSIPNVLIPELPRLLEQICTERALAAKKLSGREIAFLRKTLGFTGRRLADLLGVTPETLSRWENNREQMGLPSERMLRLRVFTTFAKDRPSFQHDVATLLEMKISDDISSNNEALFFRYGGDQLNGKRWERLPTHVGTACLHGRFREQERLWGNLPRSPQSFPLGCVLHKVD